MKKFYLFLVALVVSAFAANAVGPENLYIVGSDFGNNWNTSYKDYPMTKVADGVFTYTPTTENWFRVHDGSTMYGPGDNDILFSNSENYDKSFTLVAGCENKSFKSRANNVVTVVFTSNTAATIYNGEYTVGGGDDTVDLYIHTETTSWATTGTKMEADGADYVYTMDLDNVEYVVFTTTGKIDSNWSENCGFCGASAEGDLIVGENTLVKGSKVAFKTSSLKGSYTFTANITKGTLSVKQNGGGEIVDPENTLYFHSQPNSGNWSAGSLMTYADGVFTTTVNFDNIKFFMFRTDGVENWNGGDNAYGPAGSNMTVGAGTYEIVRNSTKCYEVSLKGEYEVKVDIANSKMTLTAVGGEVPAVAHYIHTSTPGANSDVWQTTGVKVEDGTYEISCPAVNHFIFTKNGALDWGNLDNFYGAGNNDVAVAAGVAYSLVDGTKTAFNTASLADGTYTVTVAGGKVTVVAKDVAEPEMATVYLSLGADYMLDPDKSVPVAVFSGNGVTDYSVTMAATDEEYIFFAEFDKNKYSAVTFKVNGINYPMNSATARLHNDELEGEDWYKYTYCTDGNADENWSTQSYLTYEEYVAHRDGERTGYRVAGSHNGWSLTTESDWKPMNGGICSFITSEMVVGTKFKISYIDPNQIRTNAADKAQRWWATFNLGIVGPDPYDGAEQDGDNKKVPYMVRVPKNYNHYCKYDWEVAEAGQYYVVIDPEHEVTVLLTFEPSPTLISAVSGNLSKADEVNGELVSLPGFEKYGLAQVYEFNVSNGNATIKRASSPSEFRNNYDVVYYLESDGKVVHTFSNLFADGQDEEKIDITGIVSSDMSALSFYAQYTCKGFGDDNKGEGVVFNSQKSTVSVETGEYSFEELTPGDALAGYCLVSNGTTDDGMMNWDAVFAVSYSYTDGNFAWYPAFDNVVCNDVEAELVHAEHSVLTRKVSGITINAEELHTVADDFSSYVHDTNSWAEKARSAGKFYFYAENVAQTASRAEAANVDLRIRGELKAIYPFSTQVQQAQQVKARVAAQSAAELFVFPSEDSNFDYAVKAASNLTSGVSDIELGEGEGEFELYNLQGVRVEGEAAPGLYIRRQGNKAEKIYIR